MAADIRYGLVIKHIPELIAALAALLEASQAALAALPNEDTVAVVAQATLALRRTQEMRDLAPPSLAQSIDLLHMLNNKLTGALTITMLALADLPPGHLAHPVLVAVAARARTAADVTRSASEALKAEGPPP